MTGRVIIGLLSAGLLGALAWAMLSLPDPNPGLTAPALSRLSESGVRNPVTAVLLNYRGYDTLLEVAVLLLALVSIWSLRPGTWPAPHRVSHPMLDALLRFLVPLLLLTAGYLLWIGEFAPGGAFQAGALVGGALVLLALAGRARGALERARLMRTGLAAGVIVFVGMAAAALALTGGILQYPSAHAGAFILVIEAAATISIGLTLGALYLGGRPPYMSDAPVPQEVDHD